MRRSLVSGRLSGHLTTSALTGASPRGGDGERRLLSHKSSFATGSGAAYAAPDRELGKLLEGLDESDECHEGAEYCEQSMQAQALLLRPPSLDSPEADSQWPLSL